MAFIPYRLQQSVEVGVSFSAVPIFHSTQIELEAMSINPLSSWYSVHKNLPEGFYSLPTPAVKGSGREEADENGPMISNLQNLKNRRNRVRSMISLSSKSKRKMFVLVARPG